MRISDWSSDVCSSDLPKRGFISVEPPWHRRCPAARAYPLGGAAQRVRLRSCRLRSAALHRQHPRRCRNGLRPLSRRPCSGRPTAAPAPRGLPPARPAHPAVPNWGRPPLFPPASAAPPARPPHPPQPIPTRTTSEDPRVVHDVVLTVNY